MNTKQTIKKHILEKELQIKKLYLHQTASEVCGRLLNNLIMEKAILKKELEKLEKNSIAEMIKRIIPKKKKLISDYFTK